MKTMTRAEVKAYFQAEGIEEPIPRKGRMVVRVFPTYTGRPLECIISEGGGRFTRGDRTLAELRKQEA